ncbi:MAG: hypothetical protein ACI35Z_10785 [Sphingobacterium hotanense]
MKDYKLVLAYGSFLLNVAYFGYWVYCSSRHETMVDAVAAFEKVPIFGHFYWDVIFFIATILSFIVFARRKGFLNKIAFILQILFANGYLWTHM